MSLIESWLGQADVFIVFMVFQRITLFLQYLKNEWDIDIIKSTLKLKKHAECDDSDTFRLWSIVHNACTLKLYVVIYPDFIEFP